MPKKRLLIYLSIVVLLFGCAYAVRLLTFRPVCKQQYQRVSEHKKGYVELEKIQDVPGYIDFSVESIDIFSVSKNFQCIGTVTLEVCSPVDISLGVSVFCQQSMDNLGGSDRESVELKADTPQTVTLHYKGWANGGYWLTITAGGGDKQYASIKVQM